MRSSWLGLFTASTFAFLACNHPAVGRDAGPQSVVGQRPTKAPDAIADVVRVQPLAKESRPWAAALDGGSSWLNVTRPLTLEDLRGKVVVVDFWTSCCINCIHTLPILTSLEKKFAGLPVVVVGVHSPKFDAEAGGDRLSSIVDQYGIHHPVAVDANMKIWRAWRANSWPTIVVLDAEGRVAFRDSGEPNPAELFGTVASLLDEARAENKLVEKPIEAIKPAEHESTPLRFPGKAIALSTGGYAISDTAHSRIVLTSKEGTVIDVIGSGLAGFTNGGYSAASFNKPQGIAEAGPLLYVADTENHAVRVIDRLAKTVTTAAGTGEIGKGPMRGEGAAETTALRSPWDVLANGTNVYVALAGSHQIAVYDRAKKTVAVLAGSGREARIDGDSDSAALAQPSALATDGKSLFVADSETSSIRAIDLKTRIVRTVVGKDLFVFGDVDGDKERARLQHPLGVAYWSGALWVADTYNSKIKRVDPATGETRTVDVGQKGALAEPGGISASSDGQLLVADTSHHKLLRLAPTENRLSEVTFTGLSAPLRGVAVTSVQEVDVPAANHLKFADAALVAGKTKAEFVFSIPEGTGVNEEAPFHVRVKKAEGVAITPKDIRGKGKDFQKGFAMDAEFVPGATRGSAELVLDLVTCDIKTHRVCIPLTRQLDVTFVAAKASKAISIALPEAK